MEKIIVQARKTSSGQPAEENCWNPVSRSGATLQDCRSVNKDPLCSTQRPYPEPKQPPLEPAGPLVATVKASEEQVLTKKNLLGPSSSPQRSQGTWHSKKLLITQQGSRDNAINSKLYLQSHQRPPTVTSVKTLFLGKIQIVNSGEHERGEISSANGVSLASCPYKLQRSYLDHQTSPLPSITHHSTGR
jgi:hypothetical protein